MADFVYSGTLQILHAMWRHVSDVLDLILQWSRYGLTCRWRSSAPSSNDCRPRCWHSTNTWPRRGTSVLLWSPDPSLLWLYDHQTPPSFHHTKASVACSVLGLSLEAPRDHCCTLPRSCSCSWYWYCKNGLGHILYRFNGSTCFAISLYEYENGCCLFAVKIFFVKSVVMPVLSCWVGYTAVTSNLVVSPLGVGLAVLVLQNLSCWHHWATAESSMTYDRADTSVVMSSWSRNRDKCSPIADGPARRSTSAEILSTASQLCKTNILS